MSTDPREFEHPIDGTTPNELPTVLGVGSLTPEAIEAAARAMHSHQMVGLSELAWLTLDPIGRDYWTGKARAALSAAAPFIAAQAKGEAWDEGALAAWERSTPTVNGVHYKWRHEGEPLNPYRAAIIEGKSE